MSPLPAVPGRAVDRARQARFAGRAALVLLALVALAPLPQASVPPLPRALLSAALLGLGALWAALAIRRRAPLWLPPGTGLLAALAGLGTLQLAPLALPLTDAADCLLEGVPRTAPSLVPAHTAPRVRELWALLAALLIAANGLAHSRQQRRACVALVSLGAGLSAYGILVRASVLPPIVPDLPTSVLSATWFNRNQCAAFLAPCILVGCGLVLASDPRAREAVAGRVALGAAVALCLCALVLTESRAGLAATALGAAVLVCALRRTRRAPWLRTLLCLLPLLAVVAFCVAPESFGDRWLALAGEWQRDGGRPELWHAGLRLALAFPLLGSGLGTYADLSSSTQSATVAGHVEHAHCDPLQLAAETGLAGLALGVLAVAVLGRWLWLQLGLIHEPSRARLAAGVVAALTATLAHALVDFPLQVPANALLTVTLAGCASALLRPEVRPLPCRHPRRRAMALTMLAFGLLAGACLSVREALSTWITEHAREAATSEGRHARLALAGRIDPRDGEAELLAAEDLLAGTPTAARSKDAARLARAAIARNPLSARAQRLLGRALLRLRDGAARAALVRGLRLVNPHERPRWQRDAALLCLAAGDLDSGLYLVRDLLARDDSRCEADLAAVWQVLPVYEIVRTAVPRTRGARERFAAVLLRHGEFAGREREIADLLGTEPEPGTLTIDSGVKLVGHAVQDCTAKGQRWLRTELRFRCPPEPSTRGPLSLRLVGPGAVIAREVVPGHEPFRFAFALDTTLPPGHYELGLWLAPQAAAYPLGSVEIAESELLLAQDQVHQAPQALHWATADPAGRTRAADVLPLRFGDVAWRGVRLPAQGELVVACVLPARLAATLDGVPLTPSGVAATAVQRFAIPGACAGRLVLRAAGHDVPELEALFFLPAGAKPSPLWDEPEERSTAPGRPPR